LVMNREKEIDRTIGIIGGGIMGSGIARYFLTKDFRVTVLEADKPLAQKVQRKVSEAFLGEVEKGKLEKEKVTRWLDNFLVEANVELLKEATIVIEAGPEDLSLKKHLLKKVEKVLTSGAIITSNTSALPISALAAALSQPNRFLGTHFFNPAHVMPLVEVIPGIDTDPVVLNKILKFLSSVGKKPIRTRECPGFLVNRILGAYMNEVMWLLDGVAGINDVETAAQQLGFPMGPVTVGDMVGWDIIHASNKTLFMYYGQRFALPPLLTKLDSQKRHGIKTGKGLLDHSVRPSRPTEDFAPISKNLDEKSIEGVKTRIKAAIIAESLRCLDEGVVSAGDLDNAMVMGAGLAAGPIVWADQIGLDQVLSQLEDLSMRFGSRFWPSPILRIYVLAGHIGPSAGRGLIGRY